MADFIFKDNDKICPISKIPCPGRCIYADIMENIDLGIIVLDVGNEDLIFQNKSAMNILGAATNSTNYHTLISLFMQGFEKDLIPESFGKAQTLHYKDRLLGYTAYSISREYIWIIIRDITEKARLESMTEEMNTMENINYIFSGIRHELGNPTNSIKMTLSVLKNNLDTYSSNTVSKYVDRALTEISRVEYLLQSLKSFSMFENPLIQHVNLSDFLDRFLLLVRGDLEKIGIEIKIMLSPDTEWISADPRVLQQAMLNLITNASDATLGKDNAEIAISTFKKDDMTCINVKDNGRGISKEGRKNLFRPFYTTKPHGTGLGLVITRKMLTRMNGHIEIQSREDIGTTATISIPGGLIENT